MSMGFFNDYSYFVLFYTLAAPALPWLFARERGAAGLRCASRITVVLLILFNASLWPACDAAGCGQGAIGLLGLAVMAVFSGCTTVAVTSHLVKSRG
jgi:hypothetical protein